MAGPPMLSLAMIRKTLTLLIVSPSCTHMRIPRLFSLIYLKLIFPDKGGEFLYFFLNGQTTRQFCQSCSDC
jgi:hypothetical protein